MRSSAPSTEREIGRVTAVSNFRVTVSLDPDVRSPVRAYPHHIAVVTQVGGYVLFPVAPGEHVVGIIVGAYENEAIEPDEEAGMTLQLVRARRLLRINLLGQLREEHPFLAGVSQYPPLESPAFLPTDEELRRILEFLPRPGETPRDVSLPLGTSPLYARQPVTASFNDLLGRPLGIVGNTGSGKSYSVASLLQAALRAGDGSASQAKFIILDINGEYRRCFGEPQQGPAVVVPEVNCVYVQGQSFGLPLWAFNLNEFVAFFDASLASQVPVLERVVVSAREDALNAEPGANLRALVRLIDQATELCDTLLGYLGRPTEAYVGDKVTDVIDHVQQTTVDAVALAPKLSLSIPSHLCTARDALGSQKSEITRHSISPKAAKALTESTRTVALELDDLRRQAAGRGGYLPVTADTPMPFKPAALLRDDLFYTVTSRFRGQERIQEYIATLRLRIHRQLTDRRWTVFSDPGPETLDELLGQMVGHDAERVVVFDCSLLAHDVLPFFCAVFGRTLLELRQHAAPQARTVQPFVLVLEEAHNYLKPHRDDETSGLRLAREAFERIAKEGRKFGLSLVIASQRPSDVSATVLSQCANFLIHRIQNPDDIDYFKRILPTGSRDVLDQLPILAPGDGLLVGSGVNVPARVRITLPDPHPESETPRPWAAWQASKPRFDTKGAANVWAPAVTPSAPLELAHEKPLDPGTDT